MRKIHKQLTRGWRPAICGNNPMSDFAFSPTWKKVTCKACLKKRKS